MNQDKARWIFSDTEQDKWLDGPFAIIVDANYYATHESKIKAWLDLNLSGWSLEGVVIRFPDRDQMTMFKLIWDEEL